jgi:DNA replication protein DnaC
VLFLRGGTVKQTFDSYHSKGPDDFVPLNESQEQAVEIVGAYLKELEEARTHGRGLIFLGPTGVGKTLLASIVLNEANQRGYRIEAIELAGYFVLLKDQFSLAQLMKHDDDDQWVDEYVKVRQHTRYIAGITKRSADWVLFDDVGREYEADSGWAQGEILNTLRFRWNRGLPTLLTTNLTMPELRRRYTDGLTSLLMESSEVIVMEGDDYRCRKAS